jgi:hypothetical protein
VSRKLEAGAPGLTMALEGGRSEMVDLAKRNWVVVSYVAFILALALVLQILQTVGVIGAT